MEQSYQPATPTFSQAGKSDRGELSSCYLFNVDDTTESINFVIDSVKEASRRGGGVAVDASRIRPRGSKVKGRPNSSKGVIPFAKSIEQSVGWFDQGKHSAPYYSNMVG